MMRTVQMHSPGRTFGFQRLVQASAFALTFLLVKVSLGEIAMNPRVVQQSAFTVVGITARTSNAKEMTPGGVIGKQWAPFMQDGVLAKIPNKADKAIVAVHTDYVSDKDGEYTYVLGASVTSDSEVPAGMVAKKIPAGRYAVFTSEKGAASKVVLEAWVRINSLPSRQPEATAFTAPILKSITSVRLIRRMHRWMCTWGSSSSHLASFIERESLCRSLPHASLAQGRSHGSAPGIAVEKSPLRSLTRSRFERGHPQIHPAPCENRRYRSN